MTKPRLCVAGLGRQLEVHLGQIDDHPVRIGKRKGREVDLAVQVDHKPGLLVVAADPQVGRDNLLLDHGRKHMFGHGALGGQAGRVAEQCANQGADDGDGSGCHESKPLNVRFLTH